MDGRTATLAAIAVAPVGLITFLAMDGAGAGVALVVAGFALVLIGLVGWRGRSPAVASSALAADAVAMDLEPTAPSATTAGGRGRQELAAAPRPTGSEEAGPAIIPDAVGPAATRSTGFGALDHGHDQPLRTHADLVRHLIDDHPGIRTYGSTIQVRLLHEREHGAPHELPPTLRPHD
jgi:hypothetical protein